MDVDFKNKVLSAYLGSYKTKITNETKKMMEGVSPQGRNLIISSSFLELVSYLLLIEGKKNYQVMTSTEVIDIFLGKSEIDSYRDVTVNTLIILIHNNEMPNVRRWDLVFQLALERFSKNMSVTVITPKPPENQKAFQDIGFNVVTSKTQNKPGTQTRNDDL